MQLVGGMREALDVFPLPNCGGQIVLEYELFVAPPEAGHQQDARRDSAVAQRQTFIRGSDAKPLRPFRFQRTRALYRAMAVGVGFDNRTHGHVRRDVVADHTEVLPQRGQGNLGPGGTQIRALDGHGRLKHREPIIASRAIAGRSRGSHYRQLQHVIRVLGAQHVAVGVQERRKINQALVRIVAEAPQHPRRHRLVPTGMVITLNEHPA